MKNILVDTDVLINFLRGRESARDFLTSLAEDASLCCSVITVAEIYAGMKPHEKEGTDALLDSLDIVEITREIAEKAGAYKGGIKSQNLELDDCLIAATALVKQTALATCNVKHYPMDDIQKIPALPK